MTKCAFSETQFSFCFTFEYIYKYISGATRPFPFFPNTVNEGRLDGGFDVRIDKNIFFQFKIPTYHTNASEIYWNKFHNPFYKIKLNTKSKQFQLLKDIKSKDIENKVYYSTPEFHLNPDIFNHYDAKTIVQNSAIFPIENFPSYGSGYHHLIYRPSVDYGYLFSDNPKKIHKIDNEELYKKINPTIRHTIFQQALSLHELLIQGKYLKFYLNSNEQMKFVRKIFIVLLGYRIFWLPIPNSIIPEDS